MKKIVLALLVTLFCNTTFSQNVSINYEIQQLWPYTVNKGLKDIVNSLNYEKTYAHSINSLFHSPEFHRFSLQTGIGMEMYYFKYSISENNDDFRWAPTDKSIYDYTPKFTKSLTTYANIPVYISYRACRFFSVKTGVVNAFALSESEETPWANTLHTYQPYIKFGFDITLFNNFIINASTMRNLTRFADLNESTKYNYVGSDVDGINIFRSISFSIGYKFPHKKAETLEIHTEPIEIE